jgi:hypothetical protein
MDVRSQVSGSITVAGGGALLFLIQPIAAKSLLPHFGGAAGVWVACAMFFQLVLLLGYVYSFWITRYPGPAARTAVHLALVAASLMALPARPRAEWISANPTASILLVLAASVGLPFFVLSTTSTLAQSWWAGPGKLPYRLFAVSNAACLLALLAYPLAVEPKLTAAAQFRWWTAGYLAVAVLIAMGAVFNRKRIPEEDPFLRPAGAQPDAPGRRTFPRIALAASASALWLAIANYLSQDVAPIPFLWVLPMTLYLLSFVLCFGWEGCYRPRLFRWLLPAAWVAVVWRTGLSRTAGGLGLDLGILLLALFVLCVFCHGELARTKPAGRRELAFFYLTVAAGGALGGVFVGVAAPALFSTYLELPISLVATMLLALALLYGIGSRGQWIRWGALATAALIAASSFQGAAGRVAAGRNFYGVLQIRDSGRGDSALRTLYNGRTAHGAEFLSAARRRAPTTYYGPQSGIGLLLNALDAPNRRVAIVGLGAGALASYGRAGDFFRFYEINPAVIRAARLDFHFLADSAAEIDVVNGDGRLRMEQEPPRSFDLIVLDAFTDDAIPAHLLTREAFQSYCARLRSGGALAVNVTNSYLDLNPAVEALAGAVGRDSLRFHSHSDPRQGTLAADWVVVSDGPTIMRKLGRYADSRPLKPGPLWTDEYSNLLQAWR